MNTETVPSMKTSMKGILPTENQPSIESQYRERLQDMQRRYT